MLTKSDIGVRAEGAPPRSRRAVVLVAAVLSLVLCTLIPVGPGQTAAHAAGGVPTWAQAPYAWDPSHLAAVSPGVDLGQAGGYHSDHDIREGSGRYGVPAANWSESQCTTTWESGGLLNILDACTRSGGSYTLTWQTVDLETREVTLRDSWTESTGGDQPVLPKFGGIFRSGSYLLLLTGQDNMENDPDKTVMSVKLWRILSDGTLRYPGVIEWQASEFRGTDDRVATNVFTYGASQVAVDDQWNFLYVHTNFATFSPLGENVPQPVTIVATTTGSKWEARTLHPLEFSYRQFATMANPRVPVVADHALETTTRTSGIYVTRAEQTTSGLVNVSTAKMMSTGAGVNYTGATAGDMKVIGGIAYVVGRSAPQRDHPHSGYTDYMQASAAGQRTSNAFASAVDVSGSTLPAATFNWISNNHPQDSEWVLHEPALVDVGGRAVVLRGETDARSGQNRTWYHVLDASGKALCSHQLDIPFIPAAAPVVIGDSLAWVGSPVPGPGGYLNQQVFSVRLDLAKLTNKPAVRTAAPAEFVAPTPTIAGIVKVDETVTIDMGTWTPEPTDVSYEWIIDGQTVATTKDHRFARADAGKSVVVKVTGSRSAHATKTVASEPQRISGHILTVLKEGEILGLPAVGSQLSVIGPMWSPTVPDREREYQWRRNGVDIEGATGPTYVPVSADAGSEVSLAVSGTYPGFERATYVTEPVRIALGAIKKLTDWTVTRGPRVDTESSVEGGTWSPAGATVSVQWQLSGGTIYRGPTMTPTLFRVGETVSVTVTVSANGYAKWTETRELGPVEPGPFRDAPAPTLPEVMQVDVPARATVPAWEPTRTATSYQWLRDGVPIEGATDAVYTPTADDLGRAVTVAVTGRRAGYESTVESQEPRIVQPAPVTWITAPTMVGQAVLQETLTVDPGQVNAAGATFSYQWTLDGADIPGATGQSLVMRSEFALKRIGATVTARADGYTETTTTTGSTQVMRRKYTDRPPTVVEGRAVVGQTLTAKPGAWVPAPDSFEFEWWVNGVAEDGQTGPTLLLTDAHVGATIRVLVRGIKQDYDPGLLYSNTPIGPIMGSGPLAFEQVSTPVITGDPKVGNLLSIDEGTWSPEPDVVTYEWRLGANSSGYSTVRVWAQDLGKPLQVTVTAHKAGYTSRSTTIPFTVGLAPAERIRGTSRVETAVEVSKKSHSAGKGGTVIVATGWNFPDALAATPFAAKLQAPLLLTERDVLPEATAAEIRRIRPTEIIVLGGSVAVSDAVVEALGDIDGVTATVRRISGGSRYGTAEKIVQEGWGTTGASEAFVATGEHFADALAAGTAAAAQGVPVVLVDGQSKAAPTSATRLLDRLGVETVRIAGGEIAVSKDVANRILPGTTPTRYAGKSRYETAALIADDFHTEYGQAYMATGEGFADALTGGVLAGRKKAPLLLTKRECQPASTNTHLLQKVKPASVFVLGGRVAVDDPVLEHTVCR